MLLDLPFTQGPDDECWLWEGVFGGEGYGQIDVRSGGRKSYKAHRVVYEVLVGPIPEHHILHHTCHTKACVNPKHLVPMTQADHIRVHAEEYRGENPTCRKCGADDWSYYRSPPTRICRPCNLRAGRDRYWKRKKEAK